MGQTKEKIQEVIDSLRKIASEENAPKKVASAEEMFHSDLLRGFNTSSEDFGKKVASAIIENLENQVRENNVNKIAGVAAPDPEDQMLGKTVTTTNEVEKGIVAKDKTAVVNSIVAQLLGSHGVGPSTVTTAADQTMVIPETKQAELYKEAAEKQAGAMRVVTSLFEKFATVSNEEEQEEVVDLIVKYASVAEDILEERLGENNYDDVHIEKVAEALIILDNQIFAKQAELEEAGQIIADSFLERLDEAGEVELQKQAIAEELIKQAGDLLEEKAPGKYTEEDIYNVAEALYEKLLESDESVADKVIADL